MRRFVAVALLALVAVALVVSCSSGKDMGLVGRWSAPGGVMEFYSNGTMRADSFVGTRTGTWTLNGQSVTITYDSNPTKPVTGTFDGKNLILAGTVMTRVS